MSSIELLGGIVLLALAAVALSPWLSEFRVVLSVGTLVLWLGILCLPQVWTGYLWLSTPRGHGLTKVNNATRSVIIAFLVFWAFWTLMSRQLREVYEGNYSGFLMIAQRSFEANPLLNTRDDIRRSLILLENVGYDGQFMYYMTYDPLMQAFRNDPAQYRNIVDAMPYRYGRIGFSALTHVLSLGQWPRYPATMMWLLLLSLAGSAGVLAAMAQAKQLTPMVGALIALVPGFWQSIQGGLPEPLAAASLMAGVLLASNGRWPLAGVLLALSLLVRETGVVFVLVFAAAAAVSGRHRDAMTFVLVALVPMIMWRTYVGWTVFEDWGSEDFSIIRVISDGHSQASQTFGVPLATVVTSATASALQRWHAPTSPILCYSQRDSSSQQHWPSLPRAR